MKTGQFFSGFGAVMLVVVLAACGRAENMSASSETLAATQAEGNTYQTLTLDAFADILNNDASNYTIVNVHIPYEGEIQGTDANIAYNDIDALTAALPDKNAQIILYCRSGNMSAQASRALADLGYTQIWDVPGGMNAWRESGREILNDG